MTPGWHRPACAFRGEGEDSDVRCLLRNALGLQPFAAVFYAGDTPVLIQQKAMQRLIARLLLLFALAGNLFPVALAATSASSHACCARKAHHCHQSVPDEELQFSSSRGCCDHDCCHAASTSQYAHPQLSFSAISEQTVDTHRIDPRTTTDAADFPGYHAARAPPRSSNA